MKAHCREAREFVAFHLGKPAMGVLTGQDARALAAFAHLCELYAVADARGRAAALSAMKATLDAAQPGAWPLFRKCIPHALDWGDEERLWQEVTA